MLIDLKRLDIPIGQRVLLKDVIWQEFEAILEELGEHRASKVAYEHEILEIMTPLTEVIPQYLNRCNSQGRNKTMKAFRAWVREQMQ